MPGGSSSGVVAGSTSRVGGRKDLFGDEGLLIDDRLMLVCWMLELRRVLNHWTDKTRAHLLLGWIVDGIDLLLLLLLKQS